MEEIIKQGFVELGLELHPEALGKFRKFHEYMVEKNKVMNLTGITEDGEAARLHYLDCCALLAAEDFKNKKVIDVGTGAGFPGPSKAPRQGSGPALPPAQGPGGAAAYRAPVPPGRAGRGAGGLSPHRGPAR